MDQTAVNAADYGLREGEDGARAIAAALEACKRTGARRLILPRGNYFISRDEAAEKYLWITNNDMGLKRIAFHLDGFDRLTIDGQGSLLTFSGMIIPFVIERSADITLCNLRIDWDRPFFFQGEVTASDPERNTFDLKVHEECVYQLRRDEVIFRGKPIADPELWKMWPLPVTPLLTWEQNIHWNMWFDSKTKRPVVGEAQYKLEPQPKAEEPAPGLIRFHHAAERLPEPGMTLVIKGKKEPNRASPAIVLDRSRNILLEDVTIHHAGAIGVIGQRTENVTMRRLRVCLPPGSSRVCTTTADATHFNGCRGRIVFEECLFENMLDDATNVHGSYLNVVRAEGRHTLVCRVMHAQQLGMPFAGPGDRLRLFTKYDLQPYAELTVRSVREFNCEFYAIAFEEPAADALKPESAVDNASWQAEVLMRDCVIRNNRSRSVLLQTGGKVVLERNLFEASSFAGIMFEGDGTFWWEAGKVEDVLIQNNTFRGVMGPVLMFAPQVDASRNPKARYHRNIRFVGNRIEAFRRKLIRAHAVEGLEIRGNTVVQSCSGGADEAEPVFDFTACSKIVIEENRYRWKTPAVIRIDGNTEEPAVRRNEGIAEEILRA